MSGKQASTRIVPSKLEHVVTVFIVHLTFLSFPKYIFFLVSPAPLGGGSKGKPCMKISSNSYALTPFGGISFEIFSNKMCHKREN